MIVSLGFDPVVTLLAENYWAHYAAMNPKALSDRRALITNLKDFTIPLMTYCIMGWIRDCDEMSVIVPDE